VALGNRLMSNPRSNRIDTGVSACPCLHVDEEVESQSALSNHLSSRVAMSERTRDPDDRT
jgi:hypothetical protein